METLSVLIVVAFVAISIHGTFFYHKIDRYSAGCVYLFVVVLVIGLTFLAKAAV